MASPNGLISHYTTLLNDYHRQFWLCELARKLRRQRQVFTVFLLMGIRAIGFAGPSVPTADKMVNQFTSGPNPFDFV